MPDWDDNAVYWVSTNALVLANDRDAPLSEYWLSFEDAGDCLHAGYAGMPRVSDEDKSKWSHPTFARMLELYSKRYPTAQQDATAALGAIWRYHEMKELRHFVAQEIKLLNKGAIEHTIRIEHAPIVFRDLNGNHRLMAAFYAGINMVPVMLRSTRRASC